MVNEGENDGDYGYNMLVENTTALWNNKLTILLHGKISAREPAYFYKHYYSNHFEWNNDFNKTDILSIGYEIEYLKFRFGMKYFNLKNLIYVDFYGYPRQTEAENHLFQYTLLKNFTLGNFHLDNSFIYQYIDHRKFLRLPKFISRHSLYVNLRLFKKALFMQTGLDAFYNSSYYADAYMPASSMFYLQNEKEIGDYIYTDVFLSIKVQKVRVFLKYNNILSLFKDYRYYFVPHYPQPDSGFNLGIMWIFHN
jgi:hypothetical protein